MEEEKNKIEEKNTEDREAGRENKDTKMTEIAEQAEKAEDAAKLAAESRNRKKKRLRLAHPRRFMVWMDLLGLLLLAMGLYLGIRYVINEQFVSAYRSGNYQAEKETSLTNVNLVESYLPYYNLGNVAYKEEDYTRAIAYYKQALEMDPPEGKDCAVRINLALSLIKKIDFNDLGTEKKLNNAIQTLRTARTILTAHNCAGANDDNGHSPEAEQLKKDIDEMLDKLENPPDDQDQEENNGQDDQQDQNQDDENQDDQNQDQQNQETEEERKIREQLEEQQREALEQRSSEHQQYNQNNENENYGGGNESGGQGGNSDNGKYW